MFDFLKYESSEHRLHQNCLETPGEKIARWTTVGSTTFPSTGLLALDDSRDSFRVAVYTRAESRRHRLRNAAATNSLRCRFVVCDDPTCMKALSFLPPGKRRSRPYGNCRARLPVKWTSAVLFAFLGMRRVMMFWHSSIKFTPTSPFVSISRIHLGPSHTVLRHLIFAFSSSKALNAMGQIPMLSRTPYSLETKSGFSK